MCKEKRPIIEGCKKVSGKESVSNIDIVALVIVEGAVVVALNGSRVGCY